MKCALTLKCYVAHSPGQLHIQVDAPIPGSDDKMCFQQCGSHQDRCMPMGLKRLLNNITKSLWLLLFPTAVKCSLITSLCQGGQP